MNGKSCITYNEYRKERKRLDAIPIKFEGWKDRAHHAFKMAYPVVLIAIFIKAMLYFGSL